MGSGLLSSTEENTIQGDLKCGLQLVKNLRAQTSNTEDRERVEIKTHHRGSTPLGTMGRTPHRLVYEEHLIILSFFMKSLCGRTKAKPSSTMQIPNKDSESVLIKSHSGLVLSKYPNLNFSSQYFCLKEIPLDSKELSCKYLSIESNGIREKG